MSDRIGMPSSYDDDLAREPEYIPLDEENPAVTEAREAAEAAAEAIRTLNHLTLPANGAAGLEFPSDVDRVIGDLETMMQRLPQLLGQLSRWLVDEHGSGRVGVDEPHLDAGLNVAMVRDALESASGVAQNLARHLNWARNSSTHLTGEARS